MILGSRSKRFIPTDPNVSQGALFEKQKQGESCSLIDKKQVSYIKTKVKKFPPADHTAGRSFHLI